MSQLFIPELGTHLELLEPWSFSLFYEYRNATLLAHFGYLISHDSVHQRTRWNQNTRQIEPHTYTQKIWIRPGQSKGVDRDGTPRNHYYYEDWINATESVNIILSAGTILTIDRVYLRRKQEEYSSVTFAVKQIEGTRIPRGRFWAKLAQVNDGLCFREVTENPTPKKSRR